MTHAGYNSPFYSPKRGIMQTEQAVTTEEHLHGLCCGKLEGKDVHVGTITAHNNKVFTEMLVFSWICIHLNELPLLSPVSHQLFSTWKIEAVSV